MIAREKYLEVIYFHDQLNKHVDEPEVFKYYLSAFLQAFRSVTFYLQAEFSEDARFGPWYAKKQQEMKTDPVLRFLNEMRRLTVHVNTPRVIGRFTVYVRDAMTAENEAMKALIKGPDTSTVNIVKPSDLPEEFLKSGDLARVERQFYFEGYEERDLFALCLQGIFNLDRLVGEWEAFL